MLSHHLGPVATILDSTDIVHSHPYRKFQWTAHLHNFTYRPFTMWPQPLPSPLRDPLSSLSLCMSCPSLFPCLANSYPSFILQVSSSAVTSSPDQGQCPSFCLSRHVKPQVVTASGMPTPPHHWSSPEGKFASWGTFSSVRRHYGWDATGIW